MNHKVKHVQSVIASTPSNESVYVILENGQLVHGTWYDGKIHWKEITPDLEADSDEPLDSAKTK